MWKRPKTANLAAEGLIFLDLTLLMPITHINKPHVVNHCACIGSNAYKLLIKLI